MKRDDVTGEGEKPDDSRSQLYLIVASALVIVVLGFVLVRLLKKPPEPEYAATSAPAQQALEPPPVPKNEMTSLDNAAPAPSAKPKKPGAHPAQPAPTVPAVSQASPPAPATRAVAPKSSQQAYAPITPAPMVFAPKTQTQNDAPKAHTKVGTGLDGAPVPRPSAPAPVKPRIKTAKEVRRVKAKPVHAKVVDAQAEKPRHAAKHPPAEANEPAKPVMSNPAQAEKPPQKLSKKPDEGSFVSEPVRPPPEPFAPVSPAGTAAQSAAPEAGTGLEKAKAAKPEFTLLVKTFKGEADAKDYVQALKEKGYKSFLVKKETTKFTWYHVMAGEFSDREAADKAAEDFLGKEYVRAVAQPYPEQ